MNVLRRHPRVASVWTSCVQARSTCTTMCRPTSCSCKTPPPSRDHIHPGPPRICSSSITGTGVFRFRVSDFQGFSTKRKDISVFWSENIANSKIWGLDLVRAWIIEQKDWREKAHAVCHACYMCLSTAWDRKPSVPTMAPVQVFTIGIP